MLTTVSSHTDAIAAHIVCSRLQAALNGKQLHCNSCGKHFDHPTPAAAPL